MESLDDIRKEIALRHNVRIGRDDPALVGMTLQEIGQERFLAIVSKRYEAASRELVDALSRQMSALLQQHRGEAGKTAEKLVNEASDFIDNRMRSAVTDALAEAKAEIDNSLAATQPMQATGPMLQKPEHTLQPSSPASQPVPQSPRPSGLDEHHRPQDQRKCSCVQQELYQPSCFCSQYPPAPVTTVTMVVVAWAARSTT